jgi:hypothetical protein
MHDRNSKERNAGAYDPECKGRGSVSYPGGSEADRPCIQAANQERTIGYAMKDMQFLFSISV